jgi:hypothetical protein
LSFKIEQFAIFVCVGCGREDENIIYYNIQGSALDCWSAYISFNRIDYFMVKINTYFAEWWSGPTSDYRQGQFRSKTKDEERWANSPKN